MIKYIIRLICAALYGTASLDNAVINQQLHEAVQSSNTARVQQLLNQGANCNFQSYDGSRPLHNALRKKDKSLVNALIARGALLESDDGAGRTPLIVAAAVGNCDLAQMLLDQDANIYAQDHLGVTPVHAAAYAGNLPIIVLLLRLQPSLVNSLTMSGYPIEQAATRDQISVVEFLLDQKGVIVRTNDISLKAKKGLQKACDRRQELQEAVDTQKIDKVRALLKQNYYAFTAVKQFLHTVYQQLAHAVETNNTQELQKLVDQGISLTLSDSAHNTLLHRAVLANSPNIIVYLLSIGCDPTALNNNQQTPVDLAAYALKEKETPELISLFVFFERL